MLEIVIPAEHDIWNDEREEFFDLPEVKLKMEHSLVSLSKWEAKYKKNFIGRTDITPEEYLDYFRFMTITQNIPDYVYYRLNEKNIIQIKDYINDPMTATTFSERQKSQARARGSGELITSELIYYWMVALQIPFECQKWHLNRLLTLVQVCNIKQSTPEKMAPKDIMKQNSALNKARRIAHHTKG